jgi:DNA-binding transcriptional MerR regulator|tara:strand:- start:98 stop:499 length:402 start_codon:yes stop_codon:yes gene_type:complete
MQIGDLAKELSVSTKTLRHYEKIGILPQADRSENGYRTYSRAAERTARFIVMLRRLELSLDEIRQLLEDDQSELRKNLIGILDEKRRAIRVEVAVLQGKLEDLDTRSLNLATKNIEMCGNCICALFGEDCSCN